MQNDDAVHPEGKLTKFYSISDLRGYLYHTEPFSWLEGSWGYHCIEHWNQHHYDMCKPEIVRISDSEDDLERYTEILYNIWTHDKNRRTKYDVFSPAVKIKSYIPNLGIEAIEMNEYYKVERKCEKDGECAEDEDCTCFKYTSGLFIYKVETGSPCFFAGFKTGDILRGISRPEIERIKPAKWKPLHLDYEDDYDGVEGEHVQYRHYNIEKSADMMAILDMIYEDERLIFEIVRNGKEMEIEMNVPFHEMTTQVFNSPKIVIKRVGNLGIGSDGHMHINYSDENDPTTKQYLRMKSGVDVDSHELWLEIPDTLIGVDFYINEKGELYIEYHA